MPWAQTLMIVWIQFVVAGLLMLAAARCALRWLPQPVDRIRGIQITLTAILAVPMLLALTPLPTWRLGLFSMPGNEWLDDSEARQIGARSARPEMNSAPGLAESVLSAPVSADQSNQLSTNDLSQPDVTQEIPVEPLEGRRAGASAWTIAAFVVGLLHVIAIIFFLIEWGVGAARLRQLCRSATVAPASVVSVWETVSAGLGRKVQLLISPTITTPLTFGWRHPVIVLPQDLVTANGSALRYCLSHECSHIEHDDILTWRGVRACQFLLWYQPLFWTLRRELRICQDMLADNRSTRAREDVVEYSELLVDLARKHRARFLAGALSFFNHPSELTRRVKMLLEPQAPMRPSCSRRFSLLVTMAAISCAALVTGVRVDAAAEEPAIATKSDQATKAQAEETATEQPSQSPEKPVKDDEKPADKSTDKSEHLIYHCIVVDKQSGKGIPNAKVVVRRSKSSPQANPIIGETRHTTDADGKYTVEIPPAQVAERYLYIELDVEHDQYAAKKGHGYSLGMIRKNEKLGERPFFERTELAAAEAVAGTVLSPEGAPLAGIKILGFSMENSRERDAYHSFTDTLASSDGKFRLNLMKGGDAVFWIVPKDQAIVEKIVSTQRGDLGEFRLKPGIRVAGRVLDADGKPLAGIAVNISNRDGGVAGIPVATSIRRGAISDGEGRFSFDPLPPGEYRVIPQERLSDPLTPDRTLRPLPAVFIASNVKLTSGAAAPPLEIQAVPHVVINAQWVDSQGKKTRGHGVAVRGKVESNNPWFAIASPDTEGAISLKVPRGLQDVVCQLISNEHGSLRYRRSKGGPLKNDFDAVKLGTLNENVEGFEIVRYHAPIVQISAIDEQQKPITTFSVKGRYASGIRDRELSFEHQTDGRYRTSQMLPDEDVTFTITAAGYQPATEIIKLAEGETKELVVTLKRAAGGKMP